MFLLANILAPVLMNLAVSDVIACLVLLEIDANKTSMNVNPILAKMMELVLMNVEISDVFVCLVSNSFKQFFFFIVFCSELILRFLFYYQVMLILRIPLTLSCNLSLSAITLGKSFRWHRVSKHN